MDEDASPAVARRLAEIYGRLRGHFDYAARWWPGSPFEIFVTSVLVQQCNWTAAWAAMQRLKADGRGDVAALAAADPSAVRRLLHPVAFAPTKARRLVEICAELQARGYKSVETFLGPDRDTNSLRSELLALPGVGRETADCMLLYAGAHPTFVVDAITRRVFERLDALPGVPPEFWSRPYEDLRRFFLRHVECGRSHYGQYTFAEGVPPRVALLRDFHALLVELGKHHCVRTNPHCRRRGRPGWHEYPLCLTHCREGECTACPLVETCSTGRSQKLL
jgi:endonuclease-3 related protein